ncbi:glycosyltransferase involved in cell wall biosynthesis [Thermocatellispora tengchongensis]|uniref:4,4'-diaponeurosporenoate glycosyltransferase n=1 Tax=Thermocatellispora tengchongensis TaxID=1073253 RepID=A0A840PLS4_9ACTN|nr:glycosyltransferase [Thermocatellispora tengchongensis]MBB5139899.1 glycosyltransferase involved in cell wall biosynthesis [Thermocatellispora tengchongensis]
MPNPRACLVVPAHNEAAVIGRLLGGVLADAEPGELSIVVVANGCTDRTAEIARGHGPDVTVIESPVPSKAAALRAGQDAATAYPLMYVDADIELKTGDVRALIRALERSGAHAAAPSRVLDLGDGGFLIRWYYDVWRELPSVREELYNRGAIAVSEEGARRVAALPQVMADDLVASMAFAPHERVIVADARAVIRVPRRFADLMRRRIRAVTSVTQVVDHPDLPQPPRTGVSDLLRLARSRPALAHKVVVFAGVAVLAKILARRAVRRGDFTTWLRDESSRA